jgi:hypothetical protein
LSQALQKCTAGKSFTKTYAFCIDPPSFLASQREEKALGFEQGLAHDLDHGLA